MHGVFDFITLVAELSRQFGTVVIVAGCEAAVRQLRGFNSRSRCIPRFSWIDKTRSYLGRSGSIMLQGRSFFKYPYHPV